MKKMRQSTIGTAQICAHRLTYDLDPRIPYSSGVVRAIGTAIHAGHEAYYQHRKETGEFFGNIRPWIERALDVFQGEIDRDGDRFNWQFQPKTARSDEIILKFEEAAMKMGSAISFYHQNEHYWDAGYEVLGIEEQFDLPWEGREDWVRHGTIDLILRETKTGDVILCDHKNSLAKPLADKYRAYKTPQAAYYLGVFHELGLAEPDANLRFVYDVIALDGPTFHRIEEPRSETQIAATKLQSEMLADLIDAGGPYLPNTESFLCSKAYCDHWDICPFGAALRAS